MKNSSKKTSFALDFYGKKSGSEISYFGVGINVIPRELLKLSNNLCEAMCF